MHLALSVVLAVLPLLATAAPLPESGPNRTLIVRNPTGGVDHFVYSHTVRDHILPRDDTHSAEISSPHIEDGYNAGKSGIDGVDHPLSSILSSPYIPTTASYPAKTVLDTSAHRVDGEVLSNSSDSDEAGPKGMAEGMDKSRGDDEGAKVEVSHGGMKRRGDDEGMGEQEGGEMEMMREVGEQEEQGMGQGEEGMERRE